jgi:hypothetical protein
LIGEEISKGLSKQIETRVFNKKNTAPLFSGLIIIVFLFLFAMYEGNKSSVKQNTYIEQPVVNDFYIIKFNKIFTEADPKHKYGSMVVKRLSLGPLEQVEFQVSTTIYNKVSGVLNDISDKNILLESYYGENYLYFDIDKLKKMNGDGIIYSIKRF